MSDLAMIALLLGSVFLVWLLIRWCHIQVESEET